MQLETIPLAKYWYKIKSTDHRANLLYDRHYSRKKFNKKVGSKNITVGNAIVLCTEDYSALWVMIGAMPEVRFDGRCVWDNQVFRNESKIRSSDLITEALQICRWRWAETPKQGAITWVSYNDVTEHMTDEQKLNHIPGYCYIRAKPRWQSCGMSSKGLHMLKLSPIQLDRITPVQPMEFQSNFLEELGFTRPKNYLNHKYNASGKTIHNHKERIQGNAEEETDQFDLIDQLFTDGVMGFRK